MSEKARHWGSGSSLEPGRKKTLVIRGGYSPLKGGGGGGGGEEEGGGDKQTKKEKKISSLMEDKK